MNEESTEVEVAKKKRQRTPVPSEVTIGAVYKMRGNDCTYIPRSVRTSGGIIHVRLEGLKEEGSEEEVSLKFFLEHLEIAWESDTHVDALSSEIIVRMAAMNYPAEIVNSFKAWRYVARSIGMNMGADQFDTFDTTDQGSILVAAIRDALDLEAPGFPEGFVDEMIAIVQDVPPTGYETAVEADGVPEVPQGVDYPSTMDPGSEAQAAADEEDARPFDPQEPAVEDAEAPLPVEDTSVPSATQTLITEDDSSCEAVKPTLVEVTATEEQSDLQPLIDKALGVAPNPDEYEPDFPEEETSEDESNNS